MDTITCSFLGLGLIGGSIARAFREKFPDMKIKVYDQDIPSLSLALRERIATAIYTEITADLCDADFIFLCTPVENNNVLLRTILPLLNDHAIITDVGSVKTPIHELAESLGLSNRFIGGHPMTGSERFGYPNSKPGLLENAYYIITPTDEVSAEKVEELKSLVSATKAIPLIIPYTEHDHATAAISHLPHIVASSLVNLVRTSDSEDGLMKTLAAGGFKDITRIASSSPAMWQQICLTNTKNIQQMLEQYISDLESISAALTGKDSVELYDFFDSARIYRDSFSNAAPGPIKRSFTVNIEIPDRAGALAHITALLADENINIKNINITHNRETEYGALKIEFYNEADQLKAVELLQRNEFTTYLRKI